MPYVKGESLRRRLDRERPLPVDEAVRITTQLASALEHAHTHGLSHHDVKPENVMLHEGIAMMADFGIALTAGDGAGERLTGTGMMVGTPAYVSPEQATADRTLDARSDIYSLGCVLYEMLAGEPPFTGPTAQAVIAKRFIDTAPSARRLRGTIPVRTSVMPFKKREQSLREIGATLGVATILEGSVRRAGDRVRIVAQLIDAETDEHLWVETYDRRLTDIFEIQTEVALALAAALRAELTASEQSRIRQEPTTNLEAYRLYLQGRHWRSRYTEDAVNKAIGYFEQAIDADPDYALAHAGLALAWAELPTGSLTSKPELAFARAKDAAGKALALDPKLGEAHEVLALLRFVCDYDWAGAEREFKVAMELNPGSADIYDHYAWLLGSLTRWDEAIAMAKRARELDPLSHPSDLASTLVRAGRFDEAIHEAKRSLDFNTTYPRPHSVLGWAYFFVGKIDEGIEQLERAVALAPGDSLHLGQLGEAYGLAGRTDKAREQLLKLEEMARVQYVSPYHLAYVHTGLGEYDTAVEYLERAFSDRAGGIYGIKGSYLFAPLRGHPRFTALLKRMNLA